MLTGSGRGWSGTDKQEFTGMDLRILLSGDSGGWMYCGLLKGIQTVGRLTILSTGYQFSLTELTEYPEKDLVTVVLESAQSPRSAGDPDQI